MVTMSLKRFCRDLVAGALGIKSLITLNQALNQLSCCGMSKCQDHQALIHRARMYKQGGHIKHHISSSIQTSLKASFQSFKVNSAWLVGKGDKNNFWLDNQCSKTLDENLQIPLCTHENLRSVFSSFIHDHKIVLPNNLLVTLTSRRLVCPSQTLHTFCIGERNMKQRHTTIDLYFVLEANTCQVSN